MKYIKYSIKCNFNKDPYEIYFTEEDFKNVDLYITQNPERPGIGNLSILFNKELIFFAALDCIQIIARSIVTTEDKDINQITIDEVNIK